MIKIGHDIQPQGKYSNVTDQHKEEFVELFMKNEYPTIKEAVQKFNDENPGLKMSKNLAHSLLHKKGLVYVDFLRPGDTKTKEYKNEDLREEKKWVAANYVYALSNTDTLFISIDETTFSNQKMTKKGYMPKNKRQAPPDAGAKEVMTAIVAFTNTGKCYYLVHKDKTDYRLMFHFYGLLFQKLPLNDHKHVYISIDNASWHKQQDLAGFLPEQVTFQYNVRYLKNFLPTAEGRRIP